MSQDYVWPSSSDLEIDARRLHATPRSNHGDDLGLASALREFPQTFDLTAVLICAVLVFPNILFPSLAPTAAIVVGLAICAVAPLTRWLPISMFDLVRRRHGRGVGVTAARVTLGGATAAIAFLPDNHQAGWVAVILLVGCRLLQGLAARGLSFDAVDAETAPSDSLPEAAPFRWGALAGLFAASLILGALYLALQTADFLQWGWRYPFMMAIAINIAGLFADLRVLATPSGVASTASHVRLATVGGIVVGQE